MPDAPAPAPAAPAASPSSPSGAQMPAITTLPMPTREARPVPSDRPDSMEQSLQRLRSLANKDGAPKDKAPAKGAEKTATPAKEETPAAPGESPKENPEASDQEKPATPPKDVPKDTPRESKAKPLREAYEAAKKKNTELEKKLAEITSKPVKEHPEVKAAFEELETLRAKVREYDSEMLYVNAEKSEQFQKEHYQPYVQTYQDAYNTLAEWPVPSDSGNRALTPQEFQKIVATGSGREALEAARAIYGDDIEPGVVFAARQTVLDATRRLNRARDGIRQSAQERQQKTLAQTQHEANLYNQMVSEGVEKYPHWFKPSEGDEKANELLTKGYQIADMAFSDLKDMEPERKARLYAAIRNRAGAFDRVAYELKATQAKLKVAETELAEFKKSQPGNGAPPSGDQKHEPSVSEKLRQYARR